MEVPSTPVTPVKRPIKMSRRPNTVGIPKTISSENSLQTLLRAYETYVWTIVVSVRSASAAASSPLASGPFGLVSVAARELRLTNSGK